MYGMNTQHIPMKPGIYLLWNPKTNQEYVGSSVNMRRRVRWHLAQLKAGTHGSEKLQKAYSKAGAEGFQAVVVCVCEASELAMRERREYERVKKQGLLLNNERVFGVRAESVPKSPAKAKAMKARWADPKKRAALEAKINARRADPEYRASISEKNRRAVQARWAKRRAI